MKSVVIKSLIGSALLGLSSTAAVAEPLQIICINELQPDGDFVTVCYVSEPSPTPTIPA